MFPRGVGVQRPGCSSGITETVVGSEVTQERSGQAGKTRRSRRVETSDESRTPKWFFRRPSGTARSGVFTRILAVLAVRYGVPLYISTMCILHVVILCLVALLIEYSVSLTNPNLCPLLEITRTETEYQEFYKADACSSWNIIMNCFRNISG